MERLDANKARYLGEVRRIVTEHLKPFEAEILLFGSWARGEIHRGSDIDVGVLPRQPVPAGAWSDLVEALDHSFVPYRVELVNLARADAGFVDRVKVSAVRWIG